MDKFINEQQISISKTLINQDTVLATACFASDTGDMDTTDSNAGFGFRAGLFMEEEEGKFTDKPRTFLGRY